MAFSPFDGVLLDDSRDPIPGVVAIQLHLRVERVLASQDRRPPLKAAQLQDRAAACQALLGQGLLPSRLKSLEAHGLTLGNPRDPHSFASLIRHLESYLDSVEASAYLEPHAAIWRAVDLHLSGQPGFWVERQAADGPLQVGIRDLAPPRLRALCALTELGVVRFDLATRRGAGRSGLFADKEPHLIRQMLPSLESVAAARGLDHLELDSPEGWAENPWGEALERLFEGPLQLDAAGISALQRRELPMEAAVWRAAVEQVRAWVNQGIEPADITLVHPDPSALGPVIGPLLAAEGIPFRGHPGPSLKQAPTWGPLWRLLTGLRDRDPAPLAAGLGASILPTPLGRSLRALAATLDRTDQAGNRALDQAFEALREGEKAWVKDRWAALRELPAKLQTPMLWLQDLEALAQRLELMEGSIFYPAFGLLKEVWSEDLAPMTFEPFLDALESALDVMRAPDFDSDPEGVRLLSPDILESYWMGSRATLLLDLGEGTWPQAPIANPELGWPRLQALNAALRSQEAAGGGSPDFPPRLQAFPLPQSEAGEVLPRAFHRAAYGFNRVLALTREHLVALSAERDAEGQRRSQGPFWRALEGAGAWSPPADQAASRLRWHWEGGEGGETGEAGLDGQAKALTSTRQASMQVLAPAPETAAARRAPEADLLSSDWGHGDSVEKPISPTLLEGLARCPFRVFAEKHLRQMSWEAGDRHPLNQGSLAHKLMEDLLQGLEGEPHWPAAFLTREGLLTPSAAALQALLRTRWESHASAWMAELEDVTDSEIQRLRLGIEESLAALAEMLAGDLAQIAPTEDEILRLGLPAEAAWRRELVGLEYKLEPRALALPGGGTYWVKGTVDRLERLVSGETSFFRIVDYKSSARTTLKAYTEDGGAYGTHLQLPLYQAMLEAESGVPASALLLSLKGGWKPVPMMLQGEDRTRMMMNIEALLTRARRGDFPATPGEHCATCQLSALCGRPVDIDIPDATITNDDEEEA